MNEQHAAHHPAGFPAQSRHTLDAPHVLTHDLHQLTMCVHHLSWPPIRV